MERIGWYFINRTKLAAFSLVFSGFLALTGYAQIGTPPVIAVQPLGVSVQNGGTATLTATAVSLTSMKFYWLFNGQPISNTNASVVNVPVPLVGTVSTLTINHVASASAGSYSVRVVNGVGSVISSSATLVVLVSTVTNVVNLVPTVTGMTPGGFKIHLSGPAGSNYVVEASTDLRNWTSISTDAAPTGSVFYTDDKATNFAHRYYRAKVQ